jgi:hypothetical protein
MESWQVILLVFSGLGVFNSLAFIVYLNFPGKSGVQNSVLLQVLLLAFVLQIIHALLELFSLNLSRFDSIGEAHRMWENGNDPAVTLIPNFLWTGITAMFFGLLIIWWSASKLPSPRSADTLLLLFSGLTLAGGGVGYIPFFLMVWIYSRKHGSLEIWIRRIVPERHRLLLSRAWLPATLLSSLFFLLGLPVDIVYPDPSGISGCGQHGCKRAHGSE